MLPMMVDNDAILFSHEIQEKGEIVISFGNSSSYQEVIFCV